MMATDEQIEQEIQTKGKTAPRVTPEHIESIIDGEYYFTAGDVKSVDNTIPGYHNTLNLLTFCVLVLKNGFTVTGESACVSPENFDAKIGRKIARQNAINKIWPFEGYLLAERLHVGGAS